MLDLILEPLQALKKYWNYDAFRGEQASLINHLLSGNDLIGLLSTGAGKSICFHVPGLCVEGLTLVISPLIALMEDQVYQLKSRGISAAFLHSGMTKSAIDATIDNCIYGHTKFLYLSPERIHTDMFVHRVEHLPVSFIAIDEAHCISQWGHDFRPAYRSLSVLREYFPKAVFAAFTATATDHILSEIEEVLLFKKAKIFRSSFRKENLVYTVLKANNKSSELAYLLKRLPGVGIVYARSRKGTEEIAKQINKMGLKADFYHAGLSYKFRQKKQADWIDNPNLIMVCTNAFGMGIDKSDVRYVIHMDMPSSLEEYYQEAGRAGRDGKQSFAILMYHEKDLLDAESMLEKTVVELEDVSTLYDEVARFLHIPMGGGSAFESYPFDIDLFQQKMNWPMQKILSGLSILEQYDLVLNSESVFHSSKLQIIIDKNQIIRATSRSDDFSKFMSFLFRQYEGLLSFPVKINEELIGRKLGISTLEVEENLNRIHDMEIGIYQARHEFPSIQFLSERLEKNNLGIERNVIIKRNDINREKLHAMLDFVSTIQCRENRIIEYFSEKSKALCGHCDFCLGSFDENYSIQDVQKLYKVLEKELAKPMSLDQVLHWWPFNKRNKVLAMLSLLENEEKIAIKNGYLSLIS